MLHTLCWDFHWRSLRALKRKREKHLMFCFFTAEVAVSAAQDHSLPSNQHIADPRHYSVALLWAAHQLAWETLA